MITVRVRSRSDRQNLQLVYTDPISGENHTKSAGTGNEKKAERAAKKWEIELQESHGVVGIGWQVLRTRFEDEHLMLKSENTFGIYTQGLNKFESLMGIPKNVNLVTPSIMSSFSAKLRLQKLSEGTIGIHLRSVKAMLGWGQKIGIVSNAPAVLMPEKPGSRGRGLKLFEVIRLLDAVKEVSEDRWPEFRKMLHSMWLGGLRFSDSLKISFSKKPVLVDLDREFPAIRWSLGGQKARRAEIVPITPDFARFLFENRTSGNLVNLDMSERRIKEVLTKAGRQARIKVSKTKHATAHDLRRTFAVRWSLRVHPLVLKTMMRHKDIATTMKYYVDLDSDEVASQIYVCTLSCTRRRTWETKSLQVNAEKRWGKVKESIANNTS